MSSVRTEKKRFRATVRTLDKKKGNKKDRLRLYSRKIIKSGGDTLKIVQNAPILEKRIESGPASLFLARCPALLILCRNHVRSVLRFRRVW